MAYILVFNTGQLNCACKKWSDKIPSDKTWVNIKTHFTQVHKRMKASHTTDYNPEFGLASAPMEEMATRLVILAANTAANRNTVQALTTKNTRLMAELATPNSTLVVAGADIVALRTHVT